MDYFVQKCREVYFATEDYTDATFIIVNGGLFHIFLDYSYSTKSKSTRSEYQTYLQLCQNNLETALANLNLLMPATEESIEALTLGVRPPPTITAGNIQVSDNHRPSTQSKSPNPPSHGHLSPPQPSSAKP